MTFLVKLRFSLTEHWRYVGEGGQIVERREEARPITFDHVLEILNNQSDIIQEIRIKVVS